MYKRSTFSKGDAQTSAETARRTFASLPWPREGQTPLQQGLFGQLLKRTDFCTEVVIKAEETLAIDFDARKLLISLNDLFV